MASGRPGGPRPATAPRSEADQLTLSAVSSMTNDVCSEESSVPVNFTVTVCPAKPDTLNDFCAYPVLWFRFEYVASVVVPICTVSLSNCVVVVVSAVSMCSQNENVYVVHPA